MARILIIEDNPANLELMSYLLAAFGHTPLVAYDGETGLEAAHNGPLDLIICDIQLPRMDGYTVAKHLKSTPALSAIPLVAVTAFAMVGDRDRTLAAGFDGYISKPVDPETFVSQVETFLHPAQRPAVRQAAHETAGDATGPVDKRSGVILAVDNTSANLDLLKSIFEPFGYTVLVATTINAALTLLRQQHADIILSDLHLPDMSGFDFIQIVKADPTLCDIPFVFLSATVTEGEDYKRGLALGAYKFIRRPIEPSLLLAEIEACLNEGRQ